MIERTPSEQKAIANWARRAGQVLFIDLRRLEEVPLNYDFYGFLQTPIRDSITNELGYNVEENIPGTRARYYKNENSELDLQAHLAGMEARTGDLSKLDKRRRIIRKLVEIHERLGEDIYLFTKPEEINALTKLVDDKF